ncbi:hypothetical protein [Hymenobacter wooponensis]|uniref:DUF4134 domain-containing protein n=1 Tax=Hymenobacter wooponensis TaxID=1525360 RepID=A0A4Z0MVC5_9BACT|nr:hypothetical protein [Hymenobacter wooponensis]TGD83258.1 hypothetical protein EU557_05620 [Hymenobacter wooponensis]
MKKLLLLIVFLLALISSGFSQKTLPATGGYLTDSLHATVARVPLPDSVRQAVHKLFKWGRLYSTVGAVSGGVMVASATTYIANRKDDWGTGVDLCLGTNAMVFGTMGMVRFSCKRERQVLADLEQGQPLPPDVALWFPFVTRDK